MNYRFLLPALSEVDEAAQYYEEQVTGLGADFILELDSTIDRILRFPNAWTEMPGGYRYCNFQHFPYSVIYEREDDGNILVLSVFHQHRKPRSWQKNL